MNIEENLELKKLFARFKSEVITRIPYRVNLVEILSANENRHTKVLVEILRYSRDDKYLFLNSLLDRMFSEVDDFRMEIKTPTVNSQKEYIDALIYEHGRYAIIIENKINGARDQNQQIESYLKKVHDHLKIDYSNIFVIYLTDDGSKKANEISLTPTAKSLLGYNSDEDTGRYLERNYRDDVLPWLKEDVLPNCRYGETGLLSMIQQYIDYFEGRFAITKSKTQQLEWDFFDRQLSDFNDTNDKYAWLHDKFALCAEVGIEERVSEDQNVIHTMRDSMRRVMKKMVRHSYKLDYNAAADMKGDTIRIWANEHGFHPRKWYDSTFFEYRVGKMKARIKFQITVVRESNLFIVQFFNNDYNDQTHEFAIESFENLATLFKTQFPNIQDMQASSLRSKWGEFPSEKELLINLETTVLPFMRAFCGEFEGKTDV